MEYFEAERLKSYQALAAHACADPPVRVEFADHLVSPDDGSKCIGLASWDGDGHYLVQLERGLPLMVEARTFAHELGHVVMGHIPQIAPTYRRALVQARTSAETRGAQARIAEYEKWANAYEMLKATTWHITGEIPWA